MGECIFLGYCIMYITPVSSFEGNKYFMYDKVALLTFYFEITSIFPRSFIRIYSFGENVVSLLY